MIESGISHGNAVTVATGNNVWVDHCTFDAVVDTDERKHLVVKWASRLVSFTNNKMSQQNKVSISCTKKTLLRADSF